VSAYIERWNLVLGVIFILIISFMPEGLVPGSVRLWRAGWQRLRWGQWGQTPSVDRPTTAGLRGGLTPARMPERGP
jgi:branched-chain amino acid transport system permease protein